MKATIISRQWVVKDEDNYIKTLKFACVVLFPPKINKLSS
jgi:hypothetical protein